MGIFTEWLDPIANLNHHIQFLLDGYGWKPLSTEFDYLATRQRVLDEVFPGRTYVANAFLSVAVPP